MDLERSSVSLEGDAGQTFVNVLRAAAAILAGDLGFPYDQTIQLRVAVSEMYDLVFEGPSQEETRRRTTVSVRFDLSARGIGVSLLGASTLAIGDEDRPETIEGAEVLASLVDELVITPLGDGRTIVHVRKYSPAVRGNP